MRRRSLANNLEACSIPSEGRARAFDGFAFVSLQIRDWSLDWFVDAKPSILVEDF